MLQYNIGWNILTGNPVAYDGDTGDYIDQGTGDIVYLPNITSTPQVPGGGPVSGGSASGDIVGTLTNLAGTIYRAVSGGTPVVTPTAPTSMSPWLIGGLAIGAILLLSGSEK